MTPHPLLAHMTVARASPTKRDFPFSESPFPLGQTPASYPSFLDQLSWLESVFMVGMMVSGGLGSGILWHHRARIVLPVRVRWTVSGLLVVCICFFGALLVSLSRLNSASIE